MGHHATWLNSLVNAEDMRKTIDFLMACLKDDTDRGVKVDAIAVRGISGAVIGGAFSLYSGLPLIIVLKPGDGSHSHYSVEYDDNLVTTMSHYVFVDDLICSGGTMKAVISAVNGVIGAVCNGSYLYHDSRLFHDSACGLPCHGSGDYE